MRGMRDLETALNDLQFEIQKRLRRRADLNAVGSQGLSPAKAAEVQDELREGEREARKKCLEELRMLLEFPPHHVRHKDILDAFWADGPYDKSVFIMTKYPGDGASAKAIDRELTAVITTVKEAVVAAGFQPRLASDRRFHPLLWDNVELYLLGCCRAIAIVEDKYKPELNPNVAMEWGFLRASGKPVLFLLEKTFAQMRADLGGLIDDEFQWDDPKPGIDVAVRAFLKR